MYRSSVTCMVRMNYTGACVEKNEDCVSKERPGSLNMHRDMNVCLLSGGFMAVLESGKKNKIEEMQKRIKVVYHQLAKL